MVDNYSNQFLPFATIGINTALYYYLTRGRMKGLSVAFTTVGRTFVIFNIVQLLLKKLYAGPKCIKDYRVNINDLFDRDDHFLYDNKMFRGLLR